MPISVTCPCGAQLQVVDEAAGRQIRCGQCKRLLAVPASASRTVPPPVTASSVTKPADNGDGSALPKLGMTNRRLFLVCGLVGLLGLVVAGAIGTVAAVVLLKQKQPERPVAAATQPSAEPRGGAVGDFAPAGNKLVGDASEASPDKGLGDALDVPVDPIRKPTLPGSDVPMEEGGDGSPIRKPAPRPDVGALPKLPASPTRKPNPPRADATIGLPAKPIKVTFLNSTAVGQRFCFIADNSGSMNGEPMEFVKRDMVRALGDLKPDIAFYVIFFNTRAESMPFDSWLKGSREDVEKVIPWVKEKRAGGGTRPMPAFEQAFQLKPQPDVIFFMTDGIIPPNVPTEVAALNTGKPKVKINTIMFTSDRRPRSGRVPATNKLPFRRPAPPMLDRAESLLRKIADDSGGAYRQSTAYAPEDVAEAAEAGDAKRLEEAIEYLPRMDPEVRRVVPRLLAALGKASTGPRPLILDILRKINFVDASHVPGLVALLEVSAEDVKLFALASLTSLRGDAKEGITPVLKLLAGSSRSVRLASLAALRKIGPEQLPSPLLVELAFKDSDAEMRRQAQALVAERMKAVNASNLPEVRALLKLRQSSEAVQMGLLGVTQLGPKAKECLPEVLEAFAGEDAKVRQAVVPALRAMGPAAREASGALTSSLPKSTPAHQREIALVLTALDPANPKVIELIVPLLVQNLNPETLPDKQPPPEMLLQSIQEMGEPTVDLIFAALEEATGQRGAVAANHRKYLFLALERLGKVAYSESNMRKVTSYTSPKKEIFTDVRTAAGKARRAMAP